MAVAVAIVASYCYSCGMYFGRAVASIPNPNNRRLTALLVTVASRKIQGSKQRKTGPCPSEAAGCK